MLSIQTKQLEILQSHIDRLLSEKERVIVAIDGNCAAGKTTLASHLARQYDCNVFHMDDFFLRPQQRTPEQYAEIGGNVDYELIASRMCVSRAHLNRKVKALAGCTTTDFILAIRISKAKELLEANRMELPFCLQGWHKLS